MKDPNDPPRLAEPGSEAPNELRRLFTLAEQDLPSAADLARLATKLGPALDAPAKAPDAARPPALGKVALGLVGGGVLVAGLWLALRPTQVPGPAPKAAESPAVQAPSAPAAVPAPTAEAPEAAAPAPLPPASVRAESSATATKRASGVPEDQLLEQARRSLGADPARALSLTRKHQVEFPHGVLSQEREVIAIEALRRLGRTEEAARRTERFERLYPQSAHQRKLDAPQRGK